MLIRYVLVLLMAFNCVYSRHVLNKVPVHVEKPVKLKGFQNNINKVVNEKDTGDGHRGKQTVDIGDQEKELSAQPIKDDQGDEEKEVPITRNKDDEEKLEEPGAAGDEKEAPSADNQDDNEKTDDGKMRLVPISNPLKLDDTGKAENGNSDAGDEGEKEVPPADNKDDDGKPVDGEKKMVPISSPLKLDGAGKAENDNTNDNMLDRYHPEKVSYMQDDISASWPLGIIPYHFDTSSFDDILAARIRDAMDLLEHSSCLQFRALSGRRPDNHTWVHITNPWRQRECSHKPKRKSSGEIVLVLGLDCLKQRDIIHSLLHAIGFNDEVTHPHRDQYIRIMWENIQSAYLRLFTVIPRHKKLLVEYDPMSIMHFHDRAFSKNGQATISVMMPGLQIQPSDKLSQLDKMRLRLAFGHECNRRTVDKIFDTCKTVLRTHQADEGELKLRKVRPVTTGPEDKEPES